MSGHSKWHSIKHKKGAADKKRGKLFTKLIREIVAAAKMGGGDINANPRLRTAVQTAKSNNMPADNIDRAIKKGTGDLQGENYEEVVYEGYGPQGVAVLAFCLTDNRNRSAAEIRSIFNKANGSLAGSGSVAWIFEKKGLLIIDSQKIEEEKLMDLVINAGAEDLKREGDQYEVVTQPQDFENVREALEKASVETVSAELTMIPKNEVKVTAESARGVIHLIEALEENDDVQNVYANCDIPDEVIKEMS